MTHDVTHDSSGMSYGDYLDLDTLLDAQHTRAVPPQHDELLFIIQHQTSELWMKLAIHELDAARDAIDADRLDDVYESLGSRLGTEKEDREITAAFGGGAAVLLAAAMALASKASRPRAWAVTVVMVPARPTRAHQADGTPRRPFISRMCSQAA